MIWYLWLYVNTYLCFQLKIILIRIFMITEEARSKCDMSRPYKLYGNPASQWTSVRVYDRGRDRATVCGTRCWTAIHHYRWRRTRCRRREVSNVCDNIKCRATSWHYTFRTVVGYLEFTLNPLLLCSRGVDEEGSQSLTRVILSPIS